MDDADQISVSCAAETMEMMQVGGRTTGSINSYSMPMPVSSSTTSTRHKTAERPSETTWPRWLVAF